MYAMPFRSSNFNLLTWFARPVGCLMFSYRPLGLCCSLSIHYISKSISGSWFICLLKQTNNFGPMNEARGFFLNFLEFQFGFFFFLFQVFTFPHKRSTKRNVSYLNILVCFIEICLLRRFDLFLCRLESVLNIDLVRSQHETETS